MIQFTTCQTLVEWDVIQQQLCLLFEILEIYFSKVRLLTFDSNAPYHQLGNESSHLSLSLFRVILASIDLCCTYLYLVQSPRCTKESPRLLQTLFNVKHFKIYSTSPTHQISILKFTSVIFSLQMAYPHLFDHTNIIYLFPAINLFWFNSLSLSLSHLTLYVQTVPFTEQASIHTNIPASIFMLSPQTI